MHLFNKKTLSKVLSVTVIMALLTGCSTGGDTSKAEASTDTETTIESTLTDGTDTSESTEDTEVIDIEKAIADYSDEDIETQWSDGEIINLEESGDEDIFISTSGTYILTGVKAAGQIIIDAGEKDTVNLVLNNAQLTNNNGSVIYSKQCKKVILTLAKGTENSVTDGESYSDTSDEAPNSAIYVQDNLTINGLGSLSVKANFKDGITAKDDLILASGIVNVEAKDHGIKGKDSLTVLDGEYTIKAEGDALKSNNDSDTEKGWIVIEGGAFDLQSTGDGIQAETQLTLSGGDFTIESGKDGLHAGGDISMEAMSMTLTVADDGIHSDNEVSIESGTIEIKESYEGIEGSQVQVNGGNINIISSDDGINSAGGSDEDADVTMTEGTNTEMKKPEQGAAPMGRPDQDTFAGKPMGGKRGQGGPGGMGGPGGGGNYNVIINGGNIYVNAAGDGLDANGTLTVNGGDVRVEGATDRMNSALDYDQGFNMNGGTLYASGSSSMLQVGNGTSQQPYIVILSSDQFGNGDTLSLEDAQGKEVISASFTKAGDSLILSSSNLKVGEQYSIKVNGAVTGDFTMSTDVQALSTDGSTTQLGRGRF